MKDLIDLINAVNKLSTGKMIFIFILIFLLITIN